MWYKLLGWRGLLPGWIVVVILMWVLASLLLGLTMILLLRRRESTARPLDPREPRPTNLAAVAPRALSNARAACNSRARRSRIPRGGA